MAPRQCTTVRGFIDYLGIPHTGFTAPSLPRAHAQRTWLPLPNCWHLATDTLLQVRLHGVRVDQAPARIKAATVHGLKLVSVADGVEAEVVFIMTGA